MLGATGGNAGYCDGMLHRPWEHRIGNKIVKAENRIIIEEKFQARVGVICEK